MYTIQRMYNKSVNQLITSVTVILLTLSLCHRSVYPISGSTKSFGDVKDRWSE